MSYKIIAHIIANRLRKKKKKNKHRILCGPAGKANSAKAFVAVVLNSGPLEALNNTEYTGLRLYASL